MINIEFLAGQGPCKNYTAGELVLYPALKAAEPKYLYILLSGAVDVFIKDASSGDMKKISSIIAGDMFGGREFFQGLYEYTYRAVEDVTVYLLTKESFSELSWSQPDILFEILRSAYMPLRPPTSDAPAPVKSMPAQIPAAAAPAAPITPASAPAPAASASPSSPPPAGESEKPAASQSATVTAKEISGSIYPPGHKTYLGKEFPMNEKLVFTKEYTCPLCKRNFQEFKVFRSKLYENRPMRFDLRRFYTEFNAEWYDLITCRNCYFTMFHNYFSDPKPIRKASVEEPLTAARADVLIDFAAERDINTVFTMHYLALLCCDGYPSTNEQLRAKLWGNLSWLYEDVEDKDMEKMAAIKAAEAYEQVYQSKHLTPVQEQVTCLSIAGMQHRAGMDNHIKKFIFAAKTNKLGDRTYAQLADDFWFELKLSDTD